MDENDLPQAYFGDTTQPDVNWRAIITDDEEDNDEDQPTQPDVASQLGLDPDELFDQEGF